MKKLALTIGCMVAVAGAAFAQGTVNWTAPGGNVIAAANGTAFSTFVASGTPDQLTGANTPTVGSGTSLFYYELLVSTSASSAPTTLSALGSWMDTGLSGQNATSSNGRIIANNSSQQAVANNWPANATESVMLVGWSANLGTSWAAALNELQNWSTAQTSVVGAAYFGVSAVGSLAAQSGNPGVTVFGVGAGQIQNPSPTYMELNQLGTVPVPEPGTLALAALGGASLLMFRRKK